MDTVTIRDLRNRGGQVVDRVISGESLQVTRDGKPVARIVPLPEQPLSAEEIKRRFSTLPPVDYGQLREELDGLIDPSL